MVSSETLKQGEKLIVRLEYDSDVRAPNEDCDQTWDLISFNSRHSQFQDPYKFFRRDGAGPLSELKRKLKAKLAFILSCYEHGGVAWSMRGEGMKCDFDSTDIAGLLVFNGKPGDIPAKIREEDARGFLETYNAWLSGETYKYSVEEADGTLLESCCGFYGGGYDSLRYLFDEIAAEVGNRPVEFVGEAKDLAGSYELNPTPEERKRRAERERVLCVARSAGGYA